MKIIFKYIWQRFYVCASMSILLLVDEISQQNRRLLINGILTEHWKKNRPLRVLYTVFTFWLIEKSSKCVYVRALAMLMWWVCIELFLYCERYLQM